MPVLLRLLALVAAWLLVFATDWADLSAAVLAVTGLVCAFEVGVIRQARADRADRSEA